MKGFNNVTRETAVNLTNGDYDDAGGFFIRAEVGGIIKYIPVDNGDTEVITKQFPASVIYEDPVICRKIIADGTTAENIYAGKGR